MFRISFNNLAFLLVLCLVPVPVFASEEPVTLPAIGPWLLDSQGYPAHWLGREFRGRVLFEPVNLVIVDRFSPSSDEAIRKLFLAAARGGFGERYGHSAGYWAKIGDEWFPQLSTGDQTALADGEAFLENNHGRVFGPYRDGDQWVFVGALSRETFQLFPSIHHGFASFPQAREKFARRLAEGKAYRIRGWVALGNQIDDEAETTADHDGQIVVLEAVR